ncbi:thiamine biosynthetic bifunctional enzyme [Neoconidiobolus thromboides FSU 785]|nr:thiamine biosynthetic bifunctional enzyme [Neoconidiobolus thromboides FSU 785]
MTFHTTNCLSWDFSLYLVTHRTSENFPNTSKGISNFLTHLERCFQGGVTILQLREKELSDGDFLNLAYKVKKLCQIYGVRFVINDNIKVAIEVDADGIHIGQEDMELREALELTGSKIPIGVSVKDVREANKAIQDGASYLGIGPVYPTNTKKLNKEIIGIDGVKQILNVIDTRIPVVAISGINENNINELMEKAIGDNQRRLDGVAMVSAIMDSKTPIKTCDYYKHVLREYNNQSYREFEEIEQVIKLIEKTIESRPIIHQLTNMVAINDSANVTLAIGASPIMAPDTKETEDLIKFSKALLINMGTLKKEMINEYILHGKVYNNANLPVILDPVGVGASQLRRECIDNILNEVKISVIKGNSNEIATLAGESIKSEGVDSSCKINNSMEIAEKLAIKYNCTVIMTGEIDYITNGKLRFSVHNGHHLMEKITATGCMLGAIIASYVAVEPDNPIIGVLTGTIVFTLAGELASKLSNGPGTFKYQLLDQLHHLTHYPTYQSIIKSRIKVIKY